jgi:hypothetical protein
MPMMLLCNLYYQESLSSRYLSMGLLRPSRTGPVYDLTEGIQAEDRILLHQVPAGKSIFECKKRMEKEGEGLLDEQEITGIRYGLREIILAREGG